MRTGLALAEMRAEVKILAHIRDNELKPQLKVLKQLYSNIEISQKFNENSYETMMLRRRIRQIEFDLTTTKTNLVELKKNIMEYIHKKDEIHEMIKAKDKKD